MKASSGTQRAQFPLAAGLIGSKPKLFHFKGVNKEHFSGMSKTCTLTQTNLHKNPKVLRLLSQKTEPKIEPKQENQTQNNHSVTIQVQKLVNSTLRTVGGVGGMAQGKGITQHSVMPPHKLTRDIPTGEKSIWPSWLR